MLCDWVVREDELVDPLGQGRSLPSEGATSPARPSSRGGREIARTG
jgi:hypothetical protein